MDDALDHDLRLYLVWTSAPWRPGPGPEAVFELAPGLHLVRSAATRSQLYHRVKRGLPDGSALLVGALEDAPKFKGLATGADAFLRGQPGPDGGGPTAPEPDLGLI
jgi:hypothetical protein